jgi:hypothetical protein
VPTPIERFWSIVAKRPDGCRLWRGITFGDGYGYRRIGRTMVRAHPGPWMLTYGSPPTGRLRKARGDLPPSEPEQVGRPIPANSGAASAARRMGVRTPTGAAADAHVQRRGTQQGQGVLEYGLMFALMALVAVLALALFGPQVSAIINTFAK